MYTKKIAIGELNRRLLFENWNYTQDIGSGNLKTIASSFFQWGKMEDRSGTQLLNQDQQQWQYDSKVTIRYNPNVVSNTSFVYENARYTINSVSVSGEGTKRFQILRCSKITGDVVTGGTIVPGFGPAYFFDYDGIGDETTFTGPINKNVFGASKDGTVFQVLYTGIPVAKQVLYTVSTGLFTWGIQFEPNEHAIIYYV